MARSERLRALVQLSLLTFALAFAAASDQESVSPRIAYPRAGDVVRHDTIPVWVLADDPAQLTTLTLKLNGVDLTPEFAPGSAGVKSGYHAIANLSPKSGLNRIDLIAGQRTQRVEFRFEPFPMQVRVQVREGGEPVPARVSFHGIDGTQDPTLAPSIWDSIDKGPHKVESSRNFIYTDDGDFVVHLPTGDYEVLATRGPAYSMARGVVTAKSGSLEMEIARVVDTHGWVSADFHVHAMPSRDSTLPLLDRVLSYVAQDVDVIVASDHHTVTDYRKDYPANHVWPESFEAIPGIETSMGKKHRGLNNAGHWNLWPLERERDGVVETDVRARGAKNLSEMYQMFRDYNAEAGRKRFGDFPVVIQMNHPRGMQFHPGAQARTAHGHLSRVSYDPKKPLSAESNGYLLSRPAPGLPRPIDVDSIELLNRLGFELYLEARQDWFAWIAQGFIPTGTANTDSHSMVITEAGYPRNWVRYEDPLPVDAAGLARAVRQRQVVGSTGPLIELEPWSADGSPLRGPLKTLAVTVLTSPWMPVEEVRVFVNGERVASVDLPRKPVDAYARKQLVHRVELPLTIERDAFVFVEAGDTVERLVDPEPHAAPLGRAFPAVRVLAFTNPLLVDADGDGAWTPPGL